MISGDVRPEIAEKVQQLEQAQPFFVRKKANFFERYRTD
jgi:hypothetical protein